MKARPQPSAGAQTAARFVQVALPVPVPQNFTYLLPPDLVAERSAAPGDVVRVPFGRRKLIGVVSAVLPESDQPKLRQVLELFPDYRIDALDLELAGWIRDYYACSEGEALGPFVPPRPATKARRPPFSLDPGMPDAGPKLNEAQRVAVEQLEAAVVAGSFASFLLHGVTGSGKTEVYLRSIQAALDRGRSALVLLPEIALTPQTLQRLNARFPGRVAPYHSRLSHGERCAVWEAAARGEVSVVVGARSAVFAPLRNLGVIVVDEEHEASYKADDRPRYHARDVALMRARLHDVPIVLGSATPSLESWSNARGGKHRILQLPSRVGPGDLPQVEVVDRRGPGDGGYQPISPALATALEETLARGEQAIVFHNRRGFARFLQCRACGEVLECPRCDISLTVHLRQDSLHCHYCDFRRRLPPACECGEPTLRPRGVGTQRVEVALESRFPGARILRMDHDSTTGKGASDEILRRFGAGEADILLGTQMVAKGLHFPRVTVVGVISADAGLHFPDLRAHERAFQLLAQVSGRSGREGPGRVLLQTFDPDHRVLQHARHHDVVGFLEEELRQREALGYPPARRLAAILVTAPDEGLLDRALSSLGGQLRQRLAGSGIQILGPARAALPRINRRYRGQLLLKGGLSHEGKRSILDQLERLRAALPGGRKLDLALDVDPQHLL